MPTPAGSEVVHPGVAIAPAESPADAYGTTAEFDAELDAPAEPRIGLEANSPAPKPVEKPAEPVVHKHSRRLLREATEFGIPQEEIDATPTEELDEKVYLMRREALAWARQQGQREILDAIKSPSHASSGTAPPEPGVPGGTSAHGSAPAPGGPGEEITLTANDADYDADLVAGIKKYLRQHADEMKALRDQLSQLHAAEGRRQQDTLTQQVDRAFADLGPGYEPYFGKGSVSDIDEAALARRKALLTHVELAMKGKPGTLPKKIAEAAKLLYPVQGGGSPAAEYGAGVQPAPRTPTPAPDPLAGEKERWAGAGLAHPTHREAPAEKGEAKAVQTAANFMRENGLLGDEGDELDAFL
jgi:hypothetical protein